jgi:hypothetical protein
MNEATLDSFDLHTTVATRNRYQRIAPFYDLMEGMMERRYRPWRKRLWSMARGRKYWKRALAPAKHR